AINGAGLTAPFVQAAVTGNQVTITNVALDSSVAVQVPASGVQAGQTFSVKSAVFQFFNGDVLQVTGANSPTGVSDGDTFTISRQGALNPVTFEFALDNRLVNDGNWPVTFTATDTDENLGRAVAAAINAAAAAGAFEGAPIAYQGMPNDAQTFTITRGVASQTFEFVSDARTQPATDTNWPVAYSSGVFQVDILPSATGATIGGGGNTITVHFNGAVKTFEFTTGTLPVGDQNTPIAVGATDSAGTLASKAAQTIDGPQGFNNATVAGVTGSSTLTFVSGAVVSTTGAELTTRTSVSPQTIEQDITLAISAAISAGRLPLAPSVSASYSGFDPTQSAASQQHTLVSLSDDATTRVTTSSANVGALTFVKSAAGPMRSAYDDVAVYVQPGYTPAQLAAAMAAAINGAQLDGGAGALVYA
ncbi:MAG: hypothetical protein ACREJM_13810, partial [Candidatus Saccharimonadales bacterium]